MPTNGASDDGIFAILTASANSAPPQRQYRDLLVNGIQGRHVTGFGNAQGRLSRLELLLREDRKFR